MSSTTETQELDDSKLEMSNEQLMIGSGIVSVDAEHEPDVHVLDLLIALAKHKKAICFTTTSFAVASLIYALLIPKTYTANTKILPPQQTQSVASAMLGQLGPLAGLAGKDLGIRNPADVYITMLRSRTVADNLVQKFGLMKVYDAKLLTTARKRLDDATDVNAGKDGVISISVDDRSPNRAAEVANGYVAELYKLTQTLAITEASQRRLFFEQQLHTASDELGRAEQDLRKTQETTGLIQLDSQAKALIETISVARAEVTAKEVQIQAMRSFATAQNPDMIRAEQELQVLKARLGSLERNQNGPEVATELPVGKVPAAALEYVRKLRNVKYSETVFDLLAKQYEAAKIDEARNAAVIQVLDAAVPPETKSKPKRAVIVFAGTLLGVFIAVMGAFIVEAAQYAKSQPDISVRLQLLKKYLFT